MTNYRFETLQLHVGQERQDSATDARAVQIYKTTSYVFRDSAHAQARFGLQDAGNIYGRLTNSTQDVFEKRIAALEDGIAGLATASGASAITYTIEALASKGDNIVSQKTIYGGSYNLFAHTLPRYGIDTIFVDVHNLEEIKNAINENTKAIYLETLGNPNSDIPDIDAIAEIAHSHKIPLVIDNTFGTPYLIRPIEHGADIVVHSATKFLGGHGTTLGGVIVDSGNFDWSPEKFPEICEPDPGYHGLRYKEAFGKAAFIAKARVQLMRDIGACISPFNSFLLSLGLETLPLRMKKHCDNALEVAKYLENHPKVSWVSYPGLESHSSHELAKKYLKSGYGALIGFGVKGGISACKKFIERLEIFSHLANIGDAKSLVIHPASTTHEQLSKEEQLACGVTEDFIRLSIGIEDEKDLIFDIEQALSEV